MLALKHAVVVLKGIRLKICHSKQTFKRSLQSPKYDSDSAMKNE